MLGIIAYSKEEGYRYFDHPEILSALLEDKRSLIWVDLEAATEQESTLLSRYFNFHPLAIEDCISETLLPKVDDFGDYLFLVLHGARVSEKGLSTMEINFFLGPTYLVTYHDEPSRSINNAKDRCHKNSLSITRGVDFLLHEILDGMVDNYFPVLDHLDEAVDQVEEEVFKRPEQGTLNKIFNLKKEVMHLRRVTGPQREILNRLSRDPFPVISPKAAIYFRDVYDHLARISDLSESYRDLVSGALEAYLSVISNRLNEIMKVLTIFTATLMPLTVITGIYGMNFQNMPELQSRYGYYGILGIMALIAAAMLLYFRKKKWL
jgi:magnesium transporter